MRDVIVLCYHAVSPDWESALAITPDALDRQLDHLTHHGWHGVTFAEAVLGTASGRIMAITFDDGFASVKRYAAPILERRRVPGTVFAPTQFMGGGAQLSWPGIEQWASTESAAELAALDWSDLRQLTDLGWEIGSHTLTHPHLTQLDPEALRQELAQSREECSDHVGRPCRTIAYPYGDADARVIAQAESAGYAAGAALSSHLRLNGPLSYPRVGVYHDDSWSRFHLKVARSVRQLRASSAWRLARR